MSIDLNYYLKQTKTLAREAGAILESYRKKGFTIKNKGAIDLVTEADKASEEFLAEQIDKRFPMDSILAEEGTGKTGKSGYTWVVDPLDGTTSFAHGFPYFCVSIAVVDQKNRPVVGGVYAPMLNEFFYAARGKGAFLNGDPIFVSRVDQVDRSLIGTGFPYNRREIMDQVLSRLSSVLFQVHDVRRTGSAALDLSYVASGRLDGYYEQGLKPWDVAAGIIVIEEAGGRVSRYDGENYDLDLPETIASNHLIHDQLVNLVNC